MTELDDIELLRLYVDTQSETAFTTLVERYVNLVYSVALRSVGNPHAAEEIAQAVFIVLARRAKNFSAKTVFSCWFYHTTRLTASNYLRSEIRRQNREHKASMQPTSNEGETDAWAQIAPLLDDAISTLGAGERDVIVLRFFENKSAREIAAAMQIEPSAAQKRVTRAVEKLRGYFVKRQVALSATAIAGAISEHSVHGAPAGLAKTISVTAMIKGAAAGGSTPSLAKGVLKIMAWTKVQAVTVSASVLAGLAITPFVVQHYHETHSDVSGEHWSKDALANEGYQTPVAGLKTFLWAMTHADYDACLDSATPEQRTRMEKDLKNVSREDFTAQMHTKFASVAGFQVVAARTVSPDVVAIEFRAEGANPWMKEYAFKRIGKEWKFDR